MIGNERPVTTGLAWAVLGLTLIGAGTVLAAVWKLGTLLVMLIVYGGTRP